MCSLFGLIDYQEALSSHQKNKILSVLAKECEIRGTDAAGIAYHNQGCLCIYKRPIPAHKLHFHIPKNSNIVIGHTRLTTQGNETHNYNNHPFSGCTPVGHFALAHNGVLHNDRALRQSEHLPKTHIETDSYIAVQLLEQQSKVTFDSIAHMAEKLDGSFAFTILDNDSSVYFVKGDNPLAIYHFKQYGFYLYASTDEILKKTLKRLGLTCLAYQKINLVCGDILKITSNGKQYHGKFDTSNLEMWSYYSYRPYHTFYATSRRSEYQQDLLNYAKCCGIDESDIERLLDFGYDEDTIEELLYDPALFQSCMDEMLCDMY